MADAAIIETSAAQGEPRWRAIWRNAFPFIVVAAIWELVARAGVFPVRLFPPLEVIASAFWRLTLNGILPHHALDTVVRLGAGFALAAVAGVAIGIAMVRYNLYDIDLILNKAIAYGALAVIFTVVYVLVVVVVGAVIGVTEWLSLVATAIVAVAFHPLRERAQRFANRLVYGERATPYEVLSRFSEQVGETYAGEDIHVRMVRLLAEATGASWACTGLWPCS